MKRKTKFKIAAPLILFGSLLSWLLIQHLLIGPPEEFIPSYILNTLGHATLIWSLLRLAKNKYLK